MHFKSWLQPEAKNPGKAYCEVCKGELAAVVTALRKHNETAYHKEKVTQQCFDKEPSCLFLFTITMLKVVFCI